MLTEAHGGLFAGHFSEKKVMGSFAVRIGGKVFGLMSGDSVEAALTVCLGGALGIASALQ